MRNRIFLTEEARIGAFVGGGLAFGTLAVFIAVNSMLKNSFGTPQEEAFCAAFSATNTCLVAMKAYKLVRVTMYGSLLGGLLGPYIFKPAEEQVALPAAAAADNAGAPWRPAELRHRRQ